MAILSDISIIIATKNAAACLTKLLLSIKKSTVRTELIIVDNCSTDNTLEIAKKFKLKIYKSSTERSVQRNIGAKHAHGKYLLFLDADMYLPKKLLNECINIIKKTSPAAIIIPETVNPVSYFSRIKKLEKEISWNESELEAARMIKKKIFHSIGGYNQKLIAGEDWDLHQRLLKKGQILRSTTPLYHYENSLLNEIQKKIYYSKNIRKYSSLHPNLFRKQSGFNRLRILYNKRKLLLRNIPVTIGFMILKFTEYLIYVVYTKIYKSYD